MIQKYLSRFVSASLCVATLVLGTSAQMPNPYGAPITLEQAKKVAAPAMAEAAKNNWNMAVAIVDPSGNLVYYEKMDATAREREPCRGKSTDRGAFQTAVEDVSGCARRRRGWIARVEGARSDSD
jgi:glc operon protein GlcG